MSAKPRHDTELSGRADWDVSGEARMTDKQRRMLNAVCGDLAAQLRWHGQTLSKDDYRHMLSGTMLGWRTFPGIRFDGHAPGFIMLGGSSLDLSRTQAANAITTGLHIGDHPDEQHLQGKPVRWSRVVLLGLGFSPEAVEALAA